MTDYRAQLRAVAEAIRFPSADAFSWLGVAASPYSPAHLLRLPPAVARDYLLDGLEAHLYAHFYCPGGVRPVERERASSPLQSPDFVERLSEANQGRGYWDHSWDLVAQSGTRLQVARKGISLWLGPTDYRFAAGATGLRLGVRFPKEQRKLSPGFYMALGDSGPIDGQPVLRVYWNVSQTGSAALVSLLTGLLNGGDYPFRLKVLTEAGVRHRCDRLVLYIRRADWQSLRPDLARVHAEIAHLLGDGVPALTLPVASGVGLAEDPPGGTSFGHDRCRLVAEALLAAQQQRVRTARGKVEAIERLFAGRGLDVDRPYLAPGSAASYESLPLREAASLTGSPTARPHTQIAPPAPDRLLDTAAQIGRQLASSAIWAGDVCNWVAANPYASHSHVRTGLSIHALGPNLYTGTAGIALFLGELWALTRDRQIGDTARAAMQQALSRADLVPPRERTGLYTGGFGIAHAASRLATLLGDDCLESRAQSLVEAMLPATEALGHDLLAGSAGAIVGLLRATHADRARALEAATRWGDRLLASATRSKRGLSWPRPAPLKGANLTGLSHGTAGIALALLELYAATAEQKYREAADPAFAYEDSWFDPVACGWPDLRVPVDAARYPTQRVFMAHWCHGAPGIAVARLRAFELLGSPRYLQDARLALSITHRALRANMASPDANFCLCHGLAGDAEVLRYGADVLTAQSEPEYEADANLYRQTVAQVADFGMTLYSCDNSANPWPCGDGEATSEASRPAPGLMTGLAGIGHFYLRGYSASVPPVIRL